MAAPAAASTSSSSPSAGAQWRAAVSKLPEAVLKASLALVRESSDASSSKSDVDELCTLQAKRAHGRLLEKAHECGQKDVVTAIEKADIGALGSLLAKLPADVLATIAKSLDAPSCSASKLPIAVEDELLLLGARDLLAELDSQQIKEWLPALGLKHKTSYKKWQIVDQILMDVFQLNAPSAEDLPASKKSKKEKEDPKETDASGQPLDYTPRGAPRPSIENIVKGVTATKLFDLYNATDLREYCKKHGLKTTGKKNQLIKSIISFLDGDDQNGAKDTDKGGKAASDVEDDE